MVSRTLSDASRRIVLTILIVLQKRRILRALEVNEFEPERVRAEIQAWFDGRAWLLEHDAPRAGDPRPHAQVRELPAGARGSLRWDVRGPSEGDAQRRDGILPGEVRLVDERARVQRLPPELVDAMGIRRVLGDALARR